MPKVDSKPKVLAKLTNRGPAGLLNKPGKGKPGKLVNRGEAGLLNKMPASPVPPGGGKNEGDGALPQRVVPPGPKNRVAGPLKSLIVYLDGLIEDPDNARLHPERNLQAIKDSLNLYGQLKPLVVRKQTMTVVAGNGTLRAARELGWTKLAASVVAMSAVEAAGYGLADNRSAELARWDFEVVAKLDKLLEEADQVPVGWTTDEMLVLRQNEEQFLPIQGTPEGDQAWQELWQGMPEFDQQDLTSFKSIVVHFRSEEDFLDLLRLVGQTPGDVRQRSIWHPKAEIGRFADKRYVSVEEGDEVQDEEGDDDGDEPGDDQAGAGGAEEAPRRRRGAGRGR